MIDNDIRTSAQLFRTLVWPWVQGITGGELVTIEGSDTALTNVLDQRTGIDALILHDTHVEGLASRVQTGWKFDTFTFRYSTVAGGATETGKRLRAINLDHLWPKWTVQAYVENGALAQAALAPTRDLFRIITEDMPAMLAGEECRIYQRSAAGGNRFIALNWAYVEPIDVYRAVPG